MKNPFVARILALLLVIAINLAGYSAREYARDSPAVYKTFTVLDGLDFFYGFGAAHSHNQFTWTVCRALEEPRPVWERVLVWECHPMPDDYPWRPNFDHDFPPHFDS